MRQVAQAHHVTASLHPDPVQPTTSLLILCSQPGSEWQQHVSSGSWGFFTTSPSNWLLWRIMTAYDPSHMHVIYCIHNNRTSELEALGVVWVVNHHKALWILCTGKLARWGMALQELDMNIDLKRLMFGQMARLNTLFHCSLMIVSRHKHFH